MWIQQVTDENAGNLLSDIISLISDHRMFLADTALDKLEAFLKQNPHLEVVKTLEAEINQKHRARFQQLRDRVQRLRRAESDFDEVMSLSKPFISVVYNAVVLIQMLS